MCERGQDREGAQILAQIWAGSKSRSGPDTIYGNIVPTFGDTVVRLLRCPVRPLVPLGSLPSSDLPPFRRRVAFTASTHATSAAHSVCSDACRSNPAFTGRNASHVGVAFPRGGIICLTQVSARGYQVSTLSWRARRGGRNNMDESARIRIRYGQATHGTPARTFHARHGPRFFLSG